MNFQFEPITNREKVLKWGIPLLFLMNILALTVSFSKPLFIRESSATTFTPPTKEICYQAFYSIILKKADRRLIKKEIVTFLENQNYHYFDFEEKTKINSILPKENGCTLITKDLTGLRFFKIALSKDFSSPFIYLVTNIEEKTINEVF